jgi:hypothetical protein
MTVFEWRQVFPNCEYCKNYIPPFGECKATGQRIGKRTAKKCPCFVPEEWRLEKKGGGEQ